MSRSPFLSTFALSLLATCATVASQANGLVDPKRVDKALSQLVDEHGLVGISGLVYEKGEEVYFGAHGYANREENRPMRRDTLTYIYSMTKPITGVALMSLYDKGAFKLDDPLSKYAPEFANLKVYSGDDDNGKPIYESPNRPITIRDVTRHTAGFSRGEKPGDPISKAYGQEDPFNFDNSLSQFAEKLGRVPLAYNPGEQWIYGDSVDVQAFLVERISGKPFAQYLKENIFEPLGMKETRYYFGAEFEERLTVIYVRQDDGSFVVEDPEGPTYNKAPRELTPGGWGLVSTIDDYMSFARMLLNGGELDGNRILKKDTVHLMASNALPATINDTRWLPTKGQVGFGIDFAVRIASPAVPEENSGEIGEFFWDGRASTLFWVDPENDIAAVLFTQFVPFNSVPAHKNFRDAIYYDDPSAAAPRP